MSGDQAFSMILKDTLKRQGICWPLSISSISSKLAVESFYGMVDTVENNLFNYYHDLKGRKPILPEKETSFPEYSKENHPLQILKRNQFLPTTIVKNTPLPTSLENLNQERQHLPIVFIMEKTHFAVPGHKDIYLFQTCYHLGVFWIPSICPSMKKC